MDNPFKSPTCISIGPGIRGLERGVEQITGTLRVLSYVEIEAFIIENLVAQMELGLLDPAPIWSNVKTFIKRAPIFRGYIDWIFAGYPCQPFSVAGNRKGVEDERHLFPFIERTIDIIQPYGCFFENVRSHINLGLREVIISLEKLGYKVHWGIFSAEEAGASHKRERVFIMAIRKDWLEDTSINGCERSEYETDFKRNSNSIPIEGTSQLEHTHMCNRFTIRRQESGKKKFNGINDSSHELANSNNRPVINSSGKDERSVQEKEVQQWDQNKKFIVPDSMGNSDNSRLQGWRREICEQCSYKWITRANGPFARVARPGQSQYPHEHPRTITRATESIMGIAVNGYNFREDFLRALGNSVYEDTAAMAFKTLLSKFNV